MATLNFPDAPDTGDIYFDSNSGFTYEWNGTVWISRDPSTIPNIKELDNISGSFNGSTTTFNLTVSSVAVSPVNAQQLVINIGNVMQNPGDDYTVSGSTITFTTAPTAGLVFQGTLLGSGVSLGTVEDGSISPTAFNTSDSYNVGGITVTGIATVNDFTLSGITTVANLDPSDVNVSGIGTVSNIIMTKDAAGLGATMGAAVGVVTYYGDGSNLTGLGLTFFPISYGPGIGSTNIELNTNIALDWNHPIKAGSGTITIRSGSASGTILDQFVVGSSSSITFANNSITLNPAVSLSNDTEYFVTYPAGSIKSLGDTYQNDQLIYSFTAKPAPVISLWLWGENEFGSLGQNNAGSTDRSSPVQLAGGSAATSWTSVGLSNRTVQATKADGTLWTWGHNDYGNLGLTEASGGGANLNCKSSPVQLPGTDWSQVLTDSNGQRSSAFKTDGTLWVWGYNGNGNLGMNQGPGGGNVGRSSPTQLPGTTWTAKTRLSSGATAIKTDGSLWVWGDNEYGNCGLNDVAHRSSPVQLGTDTTWSQASGGAQGSVAVKTDGTLWTWGANQSGQLGLNTQGWYNTPVYNYRSSPTQVGTATNWSKVSNGEDGGVHAIKTDGTLWAWGQNGGYGMLGLNDTVNRSSPTQIPGTTWNSIRPLNYRAIATKTDGSLWTWGGNSFGELGHNNRYPTIYSSPVQIPGSWLASDGNVIEAASSEYGIGAYLGAALRE